jgi:hypothetical protein
LLYVRALYKQADRTEFNAPSLRPLSNSGVRLDVHLLREPMSGMKSILGAAMALSTALVFGLAFWISERPAASWLDGQWLFLVALPYNWTLLHTVGAVDFSPDAPGEVAAAFGFDLALAFLAGAAVEALARQLWRLIFGSRSRA